MPQVVFNNVPPVLKFGDAPSAVGLRRWDGNRPHRAVLPRLPLRAGIGQPFNVSLGHVLRHDLGWDDEVNEIIPGIWFGDASQNPKERRPKVFGGLHADAARLISRHESLYLNVGEACTLLI